MCELRRFCWRHTPLILWCLVVGHSWYTTERQITRDTLGESGLTDFCVRCFKWGPITQTFKRFHRIRYGTKFDE
jgi:hypothetical protein